MGSDNKKKYLRRMTAASLCAVVLCLACMVSATYALFQVSVTNEGNAFEVGRFEATNATTVYADTLGLEDPVVIPDGTVCEEGSYLLNIEWSGNVEGYIKLNVATAEENSETKVPTYVVNLPKLNETDVYSLSIPLILHEKAVVTSESTWGTYVAAEDEDTVVLDMTNVIRFIDAGGITFGIPFETSVTIGTDVIGEDLETAVAYVPGTYDLTIDWTPGFAGYCVLDLLTAEEGSATSPAKYIIQLPRVEETEGGENAVITIPLYLHENTRITAVTGKGTPDNAEEWQENAGISFGAQFIASAVIGQNGSDAPVEYAAISQEAYQSGVYQLKLDWTNTTADGYCKITVGDEVYYLRCAKDVETKEKLISLDLKKEAVITVTMVKGVLPDGAAPVDDSIVSIVCGAQFEAVAAIGTVVSESETQFAMITGEAYEAGAYQLKLSWTATVDGYCVIAVGEELYYLSCPVGGEAVVIPLELKEAAIVTVTSGMGAYSGEARQLTDKGIVYKEAEAEPENTETQATTEDTAGETVEDQTVEGTDPNNE